MKMFRNFSIVKLSLDCLQVRARETSLTATAAAAVVLLARALINNKKLQQKVLENKMEKII
jgi:hypothetical protein